MGSDIHIFGEEKIEGKWKSIDDFEIDDDFITVPYNKQVYTGRNYVLFGILAGVRREDLQSFKVKGLPVDVSEMIKKCSDQWGCDGHSHSWITLYELLNLNNRMIKIKGQKNKNEVFLLKKELKKENPNYDLLYPYCQYSSCEDYIDFEVEIPMNYLINDFIKNIKKYFIEKVHSKYIGENIELDPEDYRIVFWFDN